MKLFGDWHLVKLSPPAAEPRDALLELLREVVHEVKYCHKALGHLEGKFLTASDWERVERYRNGA